MSQNLIRQASWKNLIDRVKARVASWDPKPLNLSRRLVMVKFIIQSIPMYLLSVSSAPTSVLKKIRSLQRNFLWVGRESKVKFALVSWEKVSMPKKNGSLGL